MSVETMRRVYLDAQKACGLEIGDWVKVMRRAETGEGGWGDCWAEAMNNLAGAVGKIIGVGSYGVQVEFQGSHIGQWFFPYFVLEKVDALPEEAPCPFKVGDVVRLARRWTGKESPLTWLPDFDRLIGHTAKVIGKGRPGNILAEFKGNGNDWYMPWIVFEKVKKAAHEFKPFEKVLVRGGCNSEWQPRFFAKYSSDCNEAPYMTIAATSWEQCIPYEGNEHLLGTTKAEG